MSREITTFHLSIPQSELDDLQQRLARVRWPDPETVDDNSQGPRLARLQALVARWQDGYDWRRTEALLNGYEGYKTEIDGLGVHFLHIRSPEPDALPLLMTHGWPGSVLEFRHVIGPLTDPVAHGGKASDAFHLVLPTLPGFGFSDQPTAPGWNVERIADAWIELMKRLGYARWAAQGGDWGSAVTSALGFKAPPGLVGIHLNMMMFEPTEEEQAQATPHERGMIEDARRYDACYSGYMKLQSTRPQQAGFGLADSPTGLAAWIYTLIQDASENDGNVEDVFELDELIDNIMMYWVPNAGASAARLYWEANQSMGAGLTPERPQPAKAGVSIFPGELRKASLRWAEKRFAQLVHFNELERGGHFAAWEVPDLFVDEVRKTFRSMPGAR